MTTTKTIEQLKSEANEAHAALEAAMIAKAAADKAAAEEEARQAERARRVALLDAPEPKSFATLRAHMTAIAAAMQKEADTSDTLKGLVAVTVSEPHRTERDTEQGPEVLWRQPHMSVTLRGAPVYVSVEFNAEQESGSSWRVRYTGRMRMSVGNFGERKSYPPRKDGAFNYAAAASQLMGNVWSKEREYQDALKVRSNADALKALKAEFGMTEYNRTLEVSRSHKSGGRYETYAAPMGHLYLQLDKCVTPEQAQRILAAAVAAGVKLD